MSCPTCKGRVRLPTPYPPADPLDLGAKDRAVLDGCSKLSAGTLEQWRDFDRGHNDELYPLAVAELARREKP